MADIHMFEGEDIVETLAAQAEGHEPGELGALAYHLYDTPATFDALDPRERGCSPLSDPKEEVETEKS